MPCPTPTGSPVQAQPSLYLSSTFPLGDPACHHQHLLHGCCLFLESQLPPCLASACPSSRPSCSLSSSQSRSKCHALPVPAAEGSGATLWDELPCLLAGRSLPPVQATGGQGPPRLPAASVAMIPAAGGLNGEGGESAGLTAGAGRHLVGAQEGRPAGVPGHPPQPGRAAKQTSALPSCSLSCSSARLSAPACLPGPLPTASVTQTPAARLPSQGCAQGHQGRQTARLVLLPTAGRWGWGKRGHPSPLPVGRFWGAKHGPQ